MGAPRTHLVRRHPRRSKQTLMEPSVYLSKQSVIDDTGVETVIQIIFQHEGENPVGHNVSPELALDLATNLIAIAADTNPQLVDDTI